MLRPYRVVDVFGAEPYLGNPVAVVLDAEGLDEVTMQRVAAWTNLSETTFVLPPTTPDADYRVRIFTPSSELPFAGHPTLGTCAAWRDAGGRPRTVGRADSPGDEVVVQECGAGLVPVRRDGTGRWAFAAPPLVRSGPVDVELVERLAGLLGLARAEVVDAQWVDNGPGWVALLLRDADAVLALDVPALPEDAFLGAVGPFPAGAPEALEVRAFFPSGQGTTEDPVTGSLNASLAGWLLDADRVRAPYVARQGTALGRQGRVHVDRDPDGTVWIGGGTVLSVTGEIDA